MTGADGKFAIDKVRPGVYWLTASHPLYLNPSASLPAAIAQPDPPVTLTAGQSMGDVRLTLLEPATISGKVVDWDGDPVAHANLEVIWWSYVQGVRRNMVMASASSGDDGSYKVQRVPPGTFYFEANSQPTGAEREPIPAAKPGQDIYNPSSTYFGGSDNLGGASTIDIAPGQNITLPTIEMKESSDSQRSRKGSRRYGLGGRCPRAPVVDVRPRGDPLDVRRRHSRGWVLRLADFSALIQISASASTA